jgi:hypothetical protein
VSYAILRINIINKPTTPSNTITWEWLFINFAPRYHDIKLNDIQYNENERRDVPVRI